MIFKLDREGNYLYINAVGARVLGKSPEEIIGQSFLQFVREDHRPRILEFYLDQVTRKLPSTYFEFPLIKIDGKQLWIGQTVDLVFHKDELIEVVAVAHDITERIQANQLAVNSEEKYRNIIENIHLGLMEVDLEERIVYANESFCEIMGYSFEELIGQKASDIFLSTDDEVERTRIAEANDKRSDGDASAYEVKIRRKDGSPVWMIISGAPVRNSRGEVIGSLGIHNNITGRKQEELQKQELLEEIEARNDQLHEKQEYLSAINDFAARLIKSTAIQEIVNEIKVSITKRFGFDDCAIYLVDDERKNLIRSAIDESKAIEEKETAIIPIGEGIVGAVVRNSVAEIIGDTSKDKRHLGVKGKYTSELAVPIIADGEVIGVIDSEHPTPNFYNGEHLQTFVTIANLSASRIKSLITRQKREEAELALKDSETRLRSVINSSLDAIITINEEGFVTEWNDQAEELFGYKRKEAIGDNLTNLIIPEKFRQAHSNGMKHFLKTGEGPVLNERIEIHAEHKDGHYFPVELSIVPVRMNTQYLFSAFLRDITMRKKAESDMEEALQKQTELNNLKSRLISMTSHEFRTPLTTIQSNTDLISFILEKEKVGSSSVLTKNLDRINFEITRLNNMVNDILMAGKLESENFTFNPTPTDVLQLCEDVVSQSFAYQKDGRQVKIAVNGTPKLIMLDKSIYPHVLTNLISNAFKYSEGKPSPQLSLMFTSKEMHLKVKDHGIGIPWEDQERLFESFYRAKNTGSIQGNGMGLAIVKQFIELHGAAIKIHSLEGEGAEFTIIHPYKSIKTTN